MGDKDRLSNFTYRGNEDKAGGNIAKVFLRYNLEN